MEGHGVDFKQSAKALAKALAKATFGAVLSGGAVLSTFFLLNLGLSFAFFLLGGFAGGGHGSFIMLPVAVLPFVPFVALAYVFTQKRAVMSIAAAALNSQAENLAKLGTHYLGRFLEQRDKAEHGAKLREGFDKAWSRFLRASEAPWPVRLVLSQLTGRVPMGEIVRELGEQQTPAEDVPRRAMEQVVSRAIEEHVAPSWLATVLLLVANLAWLPLCLWLANLWLAR